MRFWGKLSSRLSRLPSRAASTARIIKFRVFQNVPNTQLTIGKGTTFNVPVRSGGNGTLIIGTGNGFGYRPAPRVGSGEILLQPRGRNARIIIGANNSFSNNVSVIAAGEIVIGDGCQIGDQAVIYDCDFHEIDPRYRNRSVGPILPVRIGCNVWLGSRAMVLKGVSIGDNSVVAAMSVVTKPVPPNCVVAGNPARIIRKIE